MLGRPVGRGIKSQAAIPRSLAAGAEIHRDFFDCNSPALFDNHQQWTRLMVGWITGMGMTL
jgi:hypothetical protein